VEIQSRAHLQFPPPCATWKFARPVPEADASGVAVGRELAIAPKVDAALPAEPNKTLVFLGDVNTPYDMPAHQPSYGGGHRSSSNTRPSEKNGDNVSRHPANPRGHRATCVDAFITVRKNS